MSDHHRDEQFLRENPDVFAQLEKEMQTDSAPNGRARKYSHDVAAKEKVKIEPELTMLSTIEPREVDWLWEPFLAQGMLAGLSGDPSVGKTWIALALAAGLTNGVLPGGKICESCNVIYLSHENSPEYVVRPRFDKLEGDPTRFYLLRGVIIGEGEELQRRSITLDDVDLIDEAIKRTSAKLVIIDPLQSYIGAKVDMHRSNETRPLLDGLARIAETRSACILIVRHLSKGVASHSIYRPLGSIDVTASFRSELLAGCDPNDRERRALVQIKTNLGVVGDSVGFSIDEDGFEWSSNPSSLTAADLLAPEFGREESSALDAAENFLRKELAQEPQKVKAIQKSAEGAGISWATVRRAKDRLGIVWRKDGRQGPSIWSLPSPAKGAQKVKDAQNSLKGKNEQHYPETKHAHVSNIENSAEIPHILKDAQGPDAEKSDEQVSNDTDSPPDEPEGEL